MKDLSEERDGSALWERSDAGRFTRPAAAAFCWRSGPRTIVGMINAAGVWTGRAAVHLDFMRESLPVSQCKWTPLAPI